MLFFLSWGSVLNYLAYRLLYAIPLVRWPICGDCKTPYALHNLIPVVSWLLLQGTCPTCNSTVSALFPGIELFTVIIGSFLIAYIVPTYQVAYFVFFSALIITIRTDLETMLILRAATVWLIPGGFLLSAYGLLPISLLESISGTIFGYGILWLISSLFYQLRGIKGLGEGDPELLAFIGSFIGIAGCWATLLIGSILGSCIGIALLLTGRATRATYLPFGPFLALGALIYVIYEPIISWFLWQR